VSEALTYVKDVRNEFLRTEDTVRDALACVKALEERDEARERALAEVQKRAEDGEATLREEIEAVRRVSARAEVAASKAEEVGGLANDMRELARWSKTNAEHQNRRLAHLERDSDSSREERDRALASSVSATAQAMKVQQARLQQIEERGMLRARREAATKADIDVLKKSLGEHHAALLKVCETFDTELELSPSSFPTSSAFVRTTKTLD
jgi:phosphoribosylformylglycinamidine (FGAM) synthase-like enzyme